MSKLCSKIFICRMQNQKSLTFCDFGPSGPAAEIRHDGLSGWGPSQAGLDSLGVERTNREIQSSPWQPPVAGTFARISIEICVVLMINICAMHSDPACEGPLRFGERMRPLPGRATAIQPPVGPGGGDLQWLTSVWSAARAAQPLQPRLASPRGGREQAWGGEPWGRAVWV
eukprot:COSAG02_NODE_1619_length_11636_cov_26.969836_7_plen_171_part_00